MELYLVIREDGIHPSNSNYNSGHYGHSRKVRVYESLAIARRQRNDLNKYRKEKHKIVKLILGEDIE